MTEHAKVVPFGKYKGQPVEVMASDRQYVDWLTAQPWFREKFQPIYNIVINNVGEPSETPEHNALQALFLKEDYRLAFMLARPVGLLPRMVRSVSRQVSESVSLLNRDVGIDDNRLQSLFATAKRPYETEAIFAERRQRDEEANDRIASRIKLRQAAIDAIRQWSHSPTYLYESAVQFEEKGVDVSFEMGVQSSVWRDLYAQLPDKPSLRSPDLLYSVPFDLCQCRIEVKPAVGDDYPAILRQMKRNTSQFLFTERADPRGVSVQQMREIFDASGLTVVLKSEVDARVADARLSLGMETP